MIDSGATGNYVSTRYAQQKHIRLRQKESSYGLTLADGQPVSQNQGKVSRETDPLGLSIGRHHEKIVLDLVDIKHDVILGIPWLEYHDLTVGWKTRHLEFNNCSYRTPYKGAIWVKPNENTLASTKRYLGEYKEFESLFKKEIDIKALLEY